MNTNPASMTPEIDFLPAHYREQTAKRKGRAWRLSTIILLAMMLLAASLYQLRTRARVQKQLAEIQQRCLTIDAYRNELQGLDKKRQKLEASARLIAYLGHPWPRSQILASLLPAMPEAVSLTSIQIELMGDNSASAAPTTVNLHQENNQQAVEMLPSEADLKQLREHCDQGQLVVLLNGVTTDPSKLHEYLGQLAHQRLFLKTELVSLESPATRQAARGTGQEGSQFRARLVVSHSPGQPGGPMPQPAQAGQKTAQLKAAPGRLP